MTFTVARHLEAEIDELITHYPQKRSASLMVLHALQEQFGFRSRKPWNEFGLKLDLQPINVYELVTFYPMFHQLPVSQYHLKVCRTLERCALGGSQTASFLCGWGLTARRHWPAGRRRTA